MSRNPFERDRQDYFQNNTADPSRDTASQSSPNASNPSMVRVEHLPSGLAVSLEGCENRQDFLRAAIETLEAHGLAPAERDRLLATIILEIQKQFDALRQDQIEREKRRSHEQWLAEQRRQEQERQREEERRHREFINLLSIGSLFQK